MKKIRDMKIKSLFIGCLGLASVACSGPANKEADGPREAQLIDSVAIEDNASRIRKLAVKDNLALLVTYDSKNFIRKMSYPQMECLDSTGTLGQGPGEWIAVMVGASDVAGELPVYDIMKQAVRLVSVSDSAITVEDYSAIPLDEEEGISLPYGQLIKTSTGNWLAKENDIRRSKLAVIDLKTGEEKASFIPKLEIDNRIKGYPNDDYWLAEDNGRVALGYAQFDRIDVLDLADLSTVATIGEESVFNNDRTYTVQALAHDGKFYFLQKPQGESEPQVIRVVDRDGNEEASILLPLHAYRIAFDSDGLLLAIVETPEANLLYRYSVK